MKIFALLLMLFTLSFTGCKSPQVNQTAVPEANQVAPKTTPVRTSALPILFLAGDSTVYNVSPGLVGWGNVISPYFDSAKISLENYGKPGRSTRTFISQSWWAQILAEARAGDFVIIQLGHNDSSPLNNDGRSRGTLPGIGNENTNIVNSLTQQKETVHSYGWYLRKYIAEARAKGMMPLLCTSVSRLPQPGKELDTTRAAAWAREVAAAENVPLIDLNQRALDRWSGKSVTEIRSTYFATNESTHFNLTGAKLNADCVVAGIRALTNCPLKNFLSNKP